LAWLVMLGNPAAMPMPTSILSVADGLWFALMWGVMMVAMMLPSALPMILLYHTVSRRLAEQDVRSIPSVVFAAVYLAMWLLTGVPVYVLWTMVQRAAEVSPQFDAARPYLVAAALVIAGAYELSPLKRACLQACESPMSFLMRRWRAGYVATFNIAVQHATYCIACCWALMMILVAAGAMSLPWVMAITLVIYAEKALPRGWTSARLIGVALIILGFSLAIQPRWAAMLRPASEPVHTPAMDMR
jgi:predicted metal-binding membrane protein